MAHDKIARMKTCEKCGSEEGMQLIPRYQARKELMRGMSIELVDVVHALVRRYADYEGHLQRSARANYSASDAVPTA